MFAHVVPRVLEKYGVQFDELGNAQKGYRNESYAIKTRGGHPLNLIFFKNEPTILDRISRADYVSSLLSATLPVRIRQDPRIMRIKDGIYAGLYNYLPGQAVPWEAFSKKHIKLTGQAMAHMHRVWSDVAPADAHVVSDDLLPLIHRMERYFSDADVAAAMMTKLDVQFDIAQLADFRKLVQYVSQLPGQQIIHMDMVRGNVLFRTAWADDVWQIDSLALSGVIDFEKSTVGHPMFDIARTLAFLLVDSPKPADKIYQYFLDSGYHKRGSMSLPDPKLLTALIKFFLIHDFYKFLRHTPYESLRDNYHYSRTCVILKDYGMISSKS